MATKTLPKKNDTAAVMARLLKLEAEAKEMITFLRCPKCGKPVVLHDIGNGNNDTPWRPNRGGHLSNSHTFYCACSKFCWIGPTSGNPVEAVEEWKKVTEESQ